MAINDLSIILEHYRDLAPLYDHFYQPNYDSLANLIVREFDLQPDDGLVDLGAGTGAITNLCWKKAGLSKPAIAVDPCKELLDFASKLEGVRTRVGTCEEFIDSPDEEIDQYNKFMLCRSYHHIPNLEGVFKKFYNRISRGSKLMIIDQPRYVLPEKLKEKVRPISIYEAEAYLQSAGFTVIKHLEHQSTTWNKQDYFKCLRHRMFSVFKLVSDKDIEEGIAELDRDFFGFKESAVKDTVTTFLTGTK